MTNETKIVKKKLNSYLSVPLWVYIAVFSACLLLVLPKLICSDNSLSDPLANVGYSLFASGIAGILFDLGNNITNKRKAKKQFDAVTYSHSNLLNDIILVADYTCERLNIENYSDLSFEEQLKAILISDDEEYIKTDAYCQATEDISVWLTLVKDESDKLLNISYIMYENSNFSEKKRMLIKFISGLADTASQYFEAHTIESQKQAFELIYYRMIQLYLKIYPEQASLFYE